MNRYRMAACTLIVTLPVAISMYTLNRVLEPSVSPQPRLLFIGSGSGEYSQRMLAGARAAAREHGVELEVVAPTAADPADQQAAIVRAINSTDYDGVAFVPADPESQRELINDLAGRTKLVTVDRDCGESKRLCHIGFSPANAGALAARVVRERLSQQGKIALLATKASDVVPNTRVAERVAGFREVWGPRGQNPSMPCPTIEVAIDDNSLEHLSPDLSATLADPELSFIVAFDCDAVESALKALAALPGKRRVPIVAFDPSAATYDAIDDGRVSCAIFDDPYRNGFTAIQRLGEYSRADAARLPVPGLGTDFLFSELVRKDNLADFRRRFRS